VPGSKSLWQCSSASRPGSSAVWKVPGRYEVIAIVNIDSVEQIDPLTHSLPLFKLGYDFMCDFEWTLLGSYEEWAQRLDTLAAD
jgi:muconolactone delta-isomerase